MPKSKKKLKVTLKRSTIAVNPKHKACVKGLGLRRLNHSVLVIDNPCVRGMIDKVAYLVSVEDV
ncbi:MAG TPA: 50S ribosomal protein L30 [Chlamydiales bacterium]|nr:50S ribosomal protein L30 [Chlamydiales bacterium]